MRVAFPPSSPWLSTCTPISLLQVLTVACLPVSTLAVALLFAAAMNSRDVLWKEGVLVPPSLPVVLFGSLILLGPQKPAVLTGRCPDCVTFSCCLMSSEASGSSPCTVLSLIGYVFLLSPTFYRHHNRS